MQFHHYGYISGDPRIRLADEKCADRDPNLPQVMDVLIVGAGPAGMIAAAQLSAFPEIEARIIESRPGRLPLGHADGIQPRSVETFQAFGFAQEVIEEGYHINETAFWKPDPSNPDHIKRVAWTEDDPAGISEFPHLIFNQARVLDYFRRFMERSRSRMPVNFGWQFESLEIEDGEEYPVVCHLTSTREETFGEKKTVRAKYVLGADGATSRVRSAIGAKNSKVISNHAGGVADVLVDTDFPDAMTKSIIHSTHGSILHIPREGGYLFRTYVDLGDLDENDAHQIRNTPLDEIIAKGNEILSPYHMDVKEVAWWSVYEVGHRVTERFDDVLPEERGSKDPRVFIAGDACHTHSAKAGQGMNVSMQDGWNLAWKLAQVLRGYSSPSLLATYNTERQPVAQDLIDFDLEWSGRMAASDEGDESIEDFYVRTWEFPSGFRTEYKPGLLVAHDAKQELATGYTLGKRFKSYRVARRSDGNDLHLGHLHEADGRWRIYVFADSAPASAPESKLRTFAKWLAQDEASPVVRHTKPGDDVNSVFDVKVIYQQGHHEFELLDAPEIFRPRVGPLQLEDKNQIFGIIDIEGVAEKRDSLYPLTRNMFAKEDIFEARGISRDGAVIVVRPDMYVAHICGLEDTESLSAFFEPIFDLSK
ncbi:MAG: FAD-dependent monooxygenase [Arcanobacterium sp.]|nr:FAD-dependent monooxygenase [Arcanobacterium sp.]